MKERFLMKAIIWTKYGSPSGLKLFEIEQPIPKDDEVLIKIHSTTVTAGDCEMRRLKFPLYLALMIRLFVGIRKPKNVLIIGQEFSGEIDSVGKNVSTFKPGDAVFGTAGFRIGTYAEYICLPVSSEEGTLALKPTKISFEEAAAVPTGGFEALHFLRKANIQPGQKVLVNGAGGSIGTIAVQLAKNWGAEVSAVDRSEKLEMLVSIGADHVIDYTKEDFTIRKQTYDVIFDVVGKSPFWGSMKALSKNGYYLIANPNLRKMILGRLASRQAGKKVILEMTKQNNMDLDLLGNLTESGKLKIVIDRVFKLEQTAEAHAYVETGQKQGNVVIRAR